MASPASLPRVSIVTPSFNQGRYLEGAIQSVLAQDYPNLEYIIVDGGSSDESVEIIRKYESKLAWWVSEKDRGHADALNKGFAHATGEILAWLNSDDGYAHPTVARQAALFLQQNPAVGMVYADATLIDEAGNLAGQFASRQTDYRRLLRGSVHIPQATTFFRASLWQQVGPLDLSLFFSFDYDLWVKLARVSQLKYLPRPWAYFRLHNQGKSIKDDSRCYPDMLRVYEREVGKRWLSWLRLRGIVRKLAYAWLPWRWRIRLRKAATLK